MMTNDDTNSLQAATERALDILEPLCGRDRIGKTTTGLGEQLAWREQDCWALVFDLTDEDHPKHDRTIVVRVDNDS